MMNFTIDNLLVWSLIFLILIGTMFWFLFKAVKTKNAKYGYLIFGIIILMSILFFI